MPKYFMLATATVHVSKGIIYQCWLLISFFICVIYCYIQRIFSLGSAPLVQKSFLIFSDLEGNGKCLFPRYY